MSAISKFHCTTCGKSYTWKPELAGKKAKCKCGHPLRVPETDPSQSDLPDGFDDLAALAEGTSVEEQAYTPPSASGATCPGCGSSVDANAVICINCGQNLKTGKKLKTANVGAAAAVPAYRSYAMDNTEEKMSPQKKLIAFALVGGLAAIIAIVLAITIPATIRERERQRQAKLSGQPAVLEKVIENSEKAGGLVEAMKDGTLAKGMENPNKQKALKTIEEMKRVDRLNQRFLYMLVAKGPDAKTWAASSPRTHMVGYDHAQTLKMLDEMTNLGITEIKLTDQPNDSGDLGILASGVIGTLPQDPAKRKAIFAWYDKVPKRIEPIDYMHQVEVGQKYISVELSDRAE